MMIRTFISETYSSGCGLDRRFFSAVLAEQGEAAFRTGEYAVDIVLADDIFNLTSAEAVLAGEGKCLLIGE